MSKLSEDNKITLLTEHALDIDARVIRLEGEIGEDIIFADFDWKLTQLEQLSDKPITVRLNSEGGSFYDALSIVGRIKSCKCEVIVEGYGSVMSAATLILVAGSKRRLSSYAWFMLHEIRVSGEAHKDVPLSDQADEVKQLEREQQRWCHILGELTKQPSDWWRRSIKKQDLYLSPQECLDLGIIDEII